MSPPVVGRPHRCPPWFYGAFDNPLRKLIHKPAVLFDELLYPGDTAVDLGCGRLSGSA